MLEAAEGSLVEARRAAVATAERGDRLSAERDAAMRQVAALQAALAGESSINPPESSLQPMQSEELEYINYREAPANRLTQCWKGT